MEKMTLKNECLMEGAMTILLRYAAHLQNHLNKAVINYESTDFDAETFLADVAYALDNADVVRHATDTITSILGRMRAEVSPVFERKEVEK